MSLYADLIEPIVDKVLRNPLGALLLSSQQSLLPFIKPSNPFITSSFLFIYLFIGAFSFFFSLHSIISFPIPISVSVQPPFRFFPPLLISPSSTPVFPSKQHALPNIHSDLIWCYGFVKPISQRWRSVSSLFPSQSRIFQPVDTNISGHVRAALHFIVGSWCLERWGHLAKIHTVTSVFIFCKLFFSMWDFFKMYL